MLLEDYQGDSKVLKAIAHILNRKAPLPLDGDGDAFWGSHGQVLATDGSGETYWTNGGGGGGYTVIDETSEPVMTFDADYVEVASHNFVLVTSWTETSSNVAIDTGYCTKVTPFVTDVTVSDVVIS